MKVLTVEEVHSEMVDRLGLDPSAADLSFPEALACAMRRAAALLCPAPPVTLIRAVFRPLRGLVDDEGLRERVEDILEALIAHGDLLELDASSEYGGGDTVALIYAAPPSFVCRESGAVMLLGVATDHISPLPEELESCIEYTNHVRFLPADVELDLSGYLRQLGIVKLSQEAWLKAPKEQTPAQHLDKIDRMLDASLPSGEVSGLYILDSTRSVSYYRGRWVEPKGQTGRFIGRRIQAFGADLWCYVELQDGRPQQLLDLPVGRTKERGCDQAWRLQAAIDAVREEPQRYRLREGLRGTRVLDVFSPVPMWARRRWDCFGEPIVSTGCLFSYSFSANEIEEEIKFAYENLWLAELLPK